MMPGTQYILFSLVAICQCFNINLENTKRLRGAQGTNFGFRMHFFEEPSDDRILNLMVSAPRETLPDTGTNAGTVRYCKDVLSDKADCSEMKNHSLTFSFNQNIKGYVNEGYGSSLSASDEMYLVCAPHWRDTRYAESFGYTFMPGRCIIQNFSEQRPRRDLIAYFNAVDQGKYYLQDSENYHGMAAFGFSSDVTMESIFAVGVPGLTIFEGAVYITDVKNGESSQSGPDHYRNTLNTTAYGYEGYEVKFGNICDGSICLAAGAPNLYQKGKVRLYEWEGKSRLKEFQVLDGENNWSYFGSVICAVNVDADPFDELLIGAPLFTEVFDNVAGLDVGKVYVYKRNDVSKDYELEFSLTGGYQSYSRFGSAIENVGNINLDEFEDIIIGAPGEEDGLGCVYIYLGSSLGLSRKYAQRICASQLPNTPLFHHGFGSSFSGPVYPKDSRYPMFAVGSHLSDMVTLFQCRPIVELTATLVANPNPIEMPTNDDANKEVSSTVQLCINVTIHDSVQHPLDFSVDFEIDTQIAEENAKRAVFALANGNQEYRVSRKLNFVATTSQCTKLKAVIRKNEFFRSRFTPIEVVATYRLHEQSASTTKPVLDINAEMKKSLIFTFTSDCGPDNVCEVDLKLNGQLTLSHTEQWPHVVVNHTKEIAAHVTVTNSGETSFWTQLQIHVDQPFPLAFFKSNDIKQCKPHESDVASEEITVVCNYYQPLAKDSTIEILLVFDTETVNLERNKVGVSAMAVPMYKQNNPELTMDDNAIQLSREVYIVAPVTINGVSSPSEVAITEARKISAGADSNVDMNEIRWMSKSEGLQLNHKFQIQNQGPSFLPKTDISLSVPLFLPDGTQIVSSLTVELSTNKETITSCFLSEMSGGHFSTEKPTIGTSDVTDATSESTGMTTPHTVITTEVTAEQGSTTTAPIFVGGINRKKRSAEKADRQSSKTYVSSCMDKSKYCQTFTCQLPMDLPPGGHAEVNVTLSIDEKSISMPEDYTTFEWKLHTTVNQPTHDLFKDWDSEEEEEARTHTSTLFHLVKSGGKVNLWIIIGSIIGGLVLIFIIAIILWKCGFFKREKHYQVEKWKRESVRRSHHQASEKNDSQKEGDDI